VTTESHQAGELIPLLCKLGLIPQEGSVALTPIAGGVSSDIWKVEAGQDVFVVKRALPKLRVAAEWHAPVSRNRYEVAWMEVTASIIPDAVPRVLASDTEAGLFAMEYCDPLQFPVWKAQLLEERVNVDTAAEVGRRLARIHSRTAQSDEVARRFATDEIFQAIRLEPYLEATARRHPELSDKLLALSRRTLRTKRALVHGDVSPKNILAGPRGPVFLDAECAWYGDPAFDVAFCLNHLLLKCLAVRGAAPQLLAAFDALCSNYFRRVDWEPRAELEARTAELLPALFLARVDGKSPVEYLTTEADRQLVRATAVPLVAQPPSSPEGLKNAWAVRLGLG
jgi:5-methylthioribose kinase